MRHALLVLPLKRVSKNHAQGKKVTQRRKGAKGIVSNNLKFSYLKIVKFHFCFAT